MKKCFFSSVFLLILLSICSCQKKKAVEVNEVGYQKVDWKKAQQYYLDNMNEALVRLDSLEHLGLADGKTKSVFFELRKYFKVAEPFAGALSPEVTHRANGPALPIYNDDSGRIVEPVGLQKLEETIFSGEGTEKDYARDLYFLKGFLGNLKQRIKEKEVTPRRFFIGTHEQLMRIAVLSTSGFDTPVTGRSIKEIPVSLKSLFKVYDLSIRALIQSENPQLDREFEQHILNAVDFITKNEDFISFDRYTFLRDYLNPITRNWVQIRQASNLWDPSTVRKPFNFDASTFFEKDAFNKNYFLDVNDKDPSDQKIALGKKLFFDKNLSGTGNVSCASCHIPEKAYTDGLQVSIGNQGSKLKRNSPTLLNTIYQKSFFWDGRAGTIQSQIKSVFNNKQEFATAVHRFSDNIIEKDSAYVQLFKDAYGKIPTSNKETIRAISVYLSTLDSFDSKFDKNIRGEENTFTENEKRGFNLFMGKALCATCHFMPLTNGSVPPFFEETEKEVIGVPATKVNKKWDGDLGFYWVFEEDLHKGMFKTPSIRNAALTAPYMHNGVYDSLEEVMDFYNKGGGAGLGFDIPHQTLPFDNLNLSYQELKDLVAFINTLSDNSVSSENY